MSEKLVTDLTGSRQELLAELARLVKRGRQLVALLDCADALDKIESTRVPPEEFDAMLDEFTEAL